MKPFKRILLYAGVLFVVYVLSVGPAVYWVRSPILTDRSLRAFDRYDRRLSAYFSAYLPILWLRYKSSTAESAFAFYERLFQPKLPSQPPLILGELFFPAGFYSLGYSGEWPLPKVACDARDRMRLHGISFERGYVFYLPRSEMLVAEGTQEDIDLFETIVSDSDPSSLSRYGVYFY